MGRELGKKRTSEIDALFSHRETAIGEKNPLQAKGSMSLDALLPSSLSATPDKPEDEPSSIHRKIYALTMLYFIHH